MLGRIFTPYGICGSAIVTSTCLHGDLYIGCFPFLFLVVVDGPTSWCTSSSIFVYDSCSLVISSTCIHYSICDDVFVIGGCTSSASSLGSFEYVLLSSLSFVYYDAPKTRCLWGSFIQQGFVLQSLDPHPSALQLTLVLPQVLGSLVPRQAMGLHPH
jgi:hypothetical protein